MPDLTIPASVGLYDVVWQQYFAAGKAPHLTLQACAAWLSAPPPVDAILTRGWS